MQLVEQHIIKPNNPIFAEIDAAAFASKNLYNAANYIVLGRYWFADGEYDLTIDAFVEVAPDVGEPDGTVAAVSVELAF